MLPIYLVGVTMGLVVACSFTLFAPNLFYFIPALTTYGKSSLMLKETPKLVRMIAVPKRWFTHFYLLAVVTTAVLLGLCVSTHNGYIPPWPKLINFIKKLTPVKPHLGWTPTITGLTLILIHVYRRSYETLFVCVYSDASMNIMHYLMGMVHYVILPLTIVCEAKGMYGVVTPSFSLMSLSWWQIFGVFLFLYCNYEQHLCVIQMANLRKTSNGLTSHYFHGICYGGWFKLLSCPHFFFEVLIYIALWLVLPGAFCYQYLVLFVCVNQIFAALISHKWYQKTFGEKYPSERKAIVPYIL